MYGDNSHDWLQDTRDIAMQLQIDRSGVQLVENYIIWTRKHTMASSLRWTPPDSGHFFSFTHLIRMISSPNADLPRIQTRAAKSLAHNLNGCNTRRNSSKISLDIEAHEPNVISFGTLDDGEAYFVDKGEILRFGVHILLCLCDRLISWDAEHPATTHYNVSDDQGAG